MTQAPVFAFLCEHLHRRLCCDPKDIDVALSVEELRRVKVRELVLLALDVLISLCGPMLEEPLHDFSLEAHHRRGVAANVVDVEVQKAH